MLRSRKFFFYIMKMINFWGDVTDISAKKSTRWSPCRVFYSNNTIANGTVKLQVYRIAAKYSNKSVFQDCFKKGCSITS